MQKFVEGDARMAFCQIAGRCGEHLFSLVFGDLYFKC